MAIKTICNINNQTCNLNLGLFPIALMVGWDGLSCSPWEFPIIREHTYSCAFPPEKKRKRKTCTACTCLRGKGICTQTTGYLLSSLGLHRPTPCPSPPASHHHLSHWRPTTSQATHWSLPPHETLQAHTCHACLLPALPMQLPSLQGEGFFLPALRLTTYSPALFGKRERLWEGGTLPQ